MIATGHPLTDRKSPADRLRGDDRESTRPRPSLLPAVPAAADTIRVATWNVDLARDGPGLLLHELERGPKPQLAAVLAVIRAVRPDVLLVTRFDHDLRGRALDAFRARLAEGADGIDYPYAFHGPVNAGVPSGLDLDGDGLGLGSGDAHGWGRFPGNGGMAILSRLPLDTAAARTFRELRWRELPGRCCRSGRTARPGPTRRRRRRSASPRGRTGTCR